MPTWRAKFNGQEQMITADTPEQAALIARFRMVQAPDRSQMGPSELLARSRERAAENPEIASTGPLGFLGAVGLPLAGTAVGAGLVKDAALYGAAEGAEKLLGLPSWVGEAVGGVSPGKKLGKLILGGMFGKAKKAAGTASVEAGKAAAESATKAAEPAKIVQKAVDPAKAAYDAEVRALRLERERLRTEMVRRRAGVAEPKPAAKAEILPDGQRGWSQSKGGPAKPGPAPTPEADLEATLRASIEAEQAKKAAAAANPLQAPRLQIGAEKVGKPLGMTKEEVRVQAGPRLDEALGEASPILPDVPFGKIIDTMKALPKTGGFREAYVAKATSGKTKWQVENIRRQLEHLGLLVPAGMAAGALEE